MNRQKLIAALQSYQTSYGEEKDFIPRFLQLLAHPRAYHRDHFPGHMTGSAWIVDETRSFVLLTHHAKLNRWLQPGGHADGDENIFNVGLREAEEETGIKSFKSLTESLFDIDIHMIPARGDVPQHDHYDIRIILEAPLTADLIITNESHDLAWIPIDRIAEVSANNTSMIRMSKKVKNLFAAKQ